MRPELYPDKVLQVPSETPIQTDAAQYMIRHGKKQYNLCGEFCVTYCVADERNSKDVDSFLNFFESNDLKWYQAIFKGGLGRTTGIYDLERMLAMFGFKVPMKPFSKIVMNPLVVEDLLLDFQAIIGVQIDHSGYLVGKGIPHWVVLERCVVIDEIHVIVDIYNPYTNAIEPYTWREVMLSTGSYKQGIWIPREIL